MQTVSTWQDINFSVSCGESEKKEMALKKIAVTLEICIIFKIMFPDQ
jgi:hypothetical protein